jgi:hypothetical protein
MRKIYIFLILNLFYNQIILSKMMDLSPSEKSLFTESEEVRVTQWRKIRSIDTLIDSIKGKVIGLSYISNVADPEGKAYELQKSPLGLRNDPIRVKMNLQKAQDHLYLGDQLAAINIVEKEMKNIDPRNRGYISWAYQILFEANRQLRNHDKASLICLKMLVIGGYQEELFPEKWRFSCSMEFLNETSLRKGKESQDDFKESLIIWSNSPVVKRDSKYMVLSSVYIALGLRNVYLKNNNSIRYIEEAIGHTKSGNKYIGRAYLVLSLLKYENGNKEESLSIMRFLSGDFKGYGENLKYFEKDDVSRQISRLCLARFHASMSNLVAAETWYKDVLLEKKITGIDLLDKEKINAHLEYAHVLYMQKNYLESAKEYKQAIQGNGLEILTINNGIPFGNREQIRTSNFILVKILSKTSGRNYEAESQLLDLLSQTETDIRFLQKIKVDYKKSKEESVENILALASLAEEYGIKSNLVTNALNFRNAFYHLEYDISIIRVDLANSLNVADYTYSGINEARAISSLTQLAGILDEFKKIILDLDSFEYQVWNIQNPGIEFAKKNRFELLKRLIAMDDDISRYKLKEEIEDKIYQPKIPGALENLSKNINKMNAEMAGVNFLFSSDDNKIPNDKLNDNIELLENSYSTYLIEKMYQDLTKITIDERYFQLSRSLRPSSTFVFQKQSEILEKTMFNLYNLHKKNRSEPYSIGDSELAMAMNDSWENLFSAYKQLLLAISNVKDRIIIERKEALNKVDLINNHLLEEERILAKLKESILSEYIKISEELVKEIEPRANEFKEYVNISLSVHNKGIYDLKKERDGEIQKASEERENWLNSLRQSVNMDLMR